MMTSRRIEMTPALEWAVEFLTHYLTEPPCGFHAELMADLENADKRLIARVAPPLTRRLIRSIAVGRPAGAASRNGSVSRAIVTHEAGLATWFVRDLRSSPWRRLTMKIAN